MSGFQLAGTCYSSLADATDAYYLKQTPVVIHDLTNHYSVIVSFIPLVNENDATNFWSQSTSYYSESSATLAGYDLNNVDPAPSFRTCTEQNDPVTNFQTGMELGSAVALVMVVCFCIRRIYR